MGFWAPFGLLGGPGTVETGRLAPKTLPYRVPGWDTSISCGWAPYETSTPLLGAPKGPVLGQKGPFGGPRGPQAAPGGLIWAKLPLVGSNGWVASIPCAWAPSETSTSLLGPPKGPVLAQKAPFGDPGGLWAAMGGLIWSLLPPVGPNGRTASIPCAMCMGPL